MRADPRVLVVRAAGDASAADTDTPLVHFCQELCDELAGEPAITLALSVPVDPAAALRMAEGREGGLIFVVVGRRERLDATTNLLGQFSVDVLPIIFDLDDGTARLDLRVGGRTNIVGLVKVVVDAVRSISGTPDEEVPPGEIIDLATRFQRRDGPERDAQRAQLPVAADGSVNIHIRQSLRTALDWADAATGVLVDLWSDEPGEESAVYGLSWDRLLASLERLLGIRDAPMDKAEEQFRLVRAMLVHPTAQHTPLVSLWKLLDRDDLSIKLIMLVLAPELDIRFQRLFGALHDDMGRRHVSMGLACTILAAATAKATPRRIRSDLSALARLREFRLIEGFGDTMPAADDSLRIDPSLLDWLITGRTSWLTADPAFDAIRRQPPADALKLLPAGRRNEILSAEMPGVKRQGDPSQFYATLLSGSEPGWIEVEASVLADRELRIGPPAEAMSPDVLDRILRQAIRASQLTGSRLVVDMMEPEPHGETFWRALARRLPLCAPLPLVIADNPAWLLSLTAGEQIAVVPLSPVAQEYRIQAIRAAIASSGEPQEELAAELAERFRVPLAALPDVPPLAIAEAARAHLGQPGEAEWKAAFRSVAGSRLPHLARRVPPRARPEHGSLLDRVVLPKGQRDQLETLISHVRVGGKVLRDWHFGDLLDARGVSALFSGESGTGKTTAAHAVASELGADLYVVDLARIVSKYIGETEKNLEIIFTGAERAGAVLLFDEADALFGKRSAVNDAHDRYANIEVAYLLQRIETYDGLAILTTNHPGNIDPAFARRLRFTVDFPFPAPQDRLRIWEQAIPVHSPHRGPELDFTLAARRLETNGGSIRQMVLHALMAAAGTKDGVVRPDHLRGAARTELVRLGKHDKLQGVDDLFCRPLEDAA
jgi:hypothetical protein